MAHNPLSDRQRRFCREYIVDEVGGRAARRAGYTPSSADTRASNLLDRADVQEEIRRLRSEQTERLEIKSDVVLRELWKIATANAADLFDDNGNIKPLSQLPRSLTSAVRAVKRRATGPEGTIEALEISFWDKVKALEILARSLGLLQDNTNVRFPDGVPKELAEMTEAQLNEAICSEARLLGDGG